MAISPFTCFEQLTTDGLVVLNGGSVTVYLAGTTTLVSLFTADDLTGAAANPITLDSAGRHAMRYFAAVKYKILIKDSAGTTIDTYDNIDPAVPLGTGVLAISNGGTGASTAGAAITNLGGATAAEVADIAAELATLSGTLSSVEKTHIATGTTGQRPAVPVEGDIRRNTSIPQWEGYNNAAAWDHFWTTADFPVITKPTVQRFTSGSGNYTTPANVRYIKVTMVGPGGGGGGATANNGSAGSANTSFGSWTAVLGNGGGASGAAAGSGGTGGTDVADASNKLIDRVSGGNGSGGAGSATAGVTQVSGFGGSTPFGVGPGAREGTPGAPPANSGAGGGGGGGNSATSSGAGGGGGEYVEFYVFPTAAQVFAYVVGAGGAGGAAGTNAGRAGAAGKIVVEEFYI